MRTNASTFVGVDAHKTSLHVAMLVPGQRTAVSWQVANEPAAVRRLARKLQREAAGELQCCYEAGPLGYSLQRQLGALGVRCQVVAPSLIPIRPGEHVKTDRRDARKLAELLAAGMLTEVHPPSEAHEALRNLSRGREDVRLALTRAKHWIDKFLLRHGIVYTLSKRPWSLQYRAWLRRLHFEHAADQACFDAYLVTHEQLEERLRTLETELERATSDPAHAAAIAALRCFRGISTVTAVALVAELHDFRRFPSPRSLMSYLGLTPSEYSSGEHQKRGAITCAGNRHVRRLLTETAWQYRHRPGCGAVLRERRRGQSARVIALADRAQERLCRRYARMTAQGKPHHKIVIAIARELVGYLWAALHPDAVAMRV